jgi:hypothetical protein
MDRRPDPPTASTRYVRANHPDALAAFVGGSVVRGEGTATSDLDLVVVIAGPPAPYRETVVSDGWIIEAFVHTIDSLRRWSAGDVADRKPVLASIVAEGLTVADRGGAAALKAEMTELVEAGPAALTVAELDALRYGISNLLDDLADSPAGLERLTATAQVVESLIRLDRETGGRWSGRGKWIIRRLAEDRPDRAAELGSVAMRAAFDPSSLIELADRWLDEHGGRLIDGYRSDGRPRPARRHRGADGGAPAIDP